MVFEARAPGDICVTLEVTMKHLFGIAIIALSGLAVATAQAQAQPKMAYLSCDQFQSGPDGSWTPRASLQLPCGASIPARASISAGPRICGLDIGAELNKTCPH